MLVDFDHVQTIEGTLFQHALHQVDELVGSPLQKAVQVSAEIVLNRGVFDFLEMLVVELFGFDLVFEGGPLPFVEGQKAEHEAVQHQAEGPDVDLWRGLGVTDQELGRHVLQAAAVDVLHPDAGDRPENAEIHNLKLDALDIQVATLVVHRRRIDHDVLVLHVPVDYLTIVAVVDGVQELHEQRVGRALLENALLLAFPQVVELATFEVLHHDY